MFVTSCSSPMGIILPPDPVYKTLVPVSLDPDQLGSSSSDDTSTRIYWLPPCKGITPEQVKDLVKMQGWIYEVKAAAAQD